MADLPYEPTPRDREAERARLSRRKLSPDAPARARELAALGLPLATIAAALGVHRATLHRWRTEPSDDPLVRALCDAIHAGQQAGAVALVQRLMQSAQDGDAKAAQWLLTHAPAWRDEWSDASAVRREVQAVLGTVCRVIQNSDLTLEQQDRLALQLQAAGLGRLPGDPEPEADLPEPASFE